jgi:hypothetical protein
MLSNILSFLGTLLSYVLGRKARADEARNSPEMVANAKARDEVKRQDEIETTIIKASQNDPKALEDLRRMAGD